MVYKNTIYTSWVSYKIAERDVFVQSPCPTPLLVLLALAAAPIHIQSLQGSSSARIMAPTSSSSFNGVSLCCLLAGGQLGTVSGKFIKGQGWQAYLLLDEKTNQ